MSANIQDNTSSIPSLNTQDINDEKKIVVDRENKVYEVPKSEFLKIAKRVR